MNLISQHFQHTIRSLQCHHITAILSDYCHITRSLSYRQITAIPPNHCHTITSPLYHQITAIPSGHCHTIRPLHQISAIPSDLCIRSQRHHQISASDHSHIITSLYQIIIVTPSALKWNQHWHKIGICMLSSRTTAACQPDSFSEKNFILHTIFWMDSYKSFLFIQPSTKYKCVQTCLDEGTQ